MQKQKNSGLRDYNKCQWNKGEFVLAVIKSVGIVIFLSFFFYKSMWAAIPLSFIGVLYFKKLKLQKIEKEKQEMLLQFKECMNSVTVALKAGYAPENAFLESRSDIKLLYGENSVMYRELEFIKRGLIINIPLEEQLKDFGKRSGLDEIKQFAEIFSVAKRSGGDMPVILGACSEVIQQKIELTREIAVSLSGKQMEQNIMKLMPFGILLYIGGSNPGYFDMLYHNLQGVGIMTLCLILYLAAYILGDKIMHKISCEV